MDDKMSHRLLYGFGPLFVDKTVRQKQNRGVSRPLYFGKPVKEQDAFRRLERRIGNDILAAKIYILKPHLHYIYCRI